MPDDHLVTPVRSRYSAVDPRDVPPARQPGEPSTRRLEVGRAQQTERAERLFELHLGKRDLTIEISSTDIHPTSVRLTIWCAAPGPGERPYRRHEAGYLRTPAEIDALVEALGRARARLVEAQATQPSPSRAQPNRSQPNE